MRRHGVAGAVTAMAVRTADDAVPAHCLRTGKNCRAPSGAGMPWPHRDLHGRRFAFDLRRCAGQRTRELARLGRSDGPDVPAREKRPAWLMSARGASGGSPPACRRSVATIRRLEGRSPMRYLSGRDRPYVVRGRASRGVGGARWGVAASGQVRLRIVMTASPRRWARQAHELITSRQLADL